MDENEKQNSYTGLEIAVTGLSIRVPKAKNIEEFWENLENGVESISFYSDEELLEAGTNPDLLQDPNYVKAGAILEEKEYFDAVFFGYTPREAELLDPQIRIFHECCRQALEDGGIDPEVYPGLIGVYAGAGQNMEWEARVLLSGKSDSFGDFAASRLTGIRYMCTRLSFNLNLKGPSITMQTACSTSLVAIHMACQALLSGECEAALAGGVTISPRNKTGYLYEEDMILSRDGHNRTFDAAATGTVFGEGAGVVLLKSLEDALTCEDYIYAVIRSTSVNNDGNRKVGFTAPSVEAQVDMMRAAYHLAGIHPETIGYVEAHGTATYLGDPIEIEALKQAFNTRKKGFCMIGSVKTNLGHLDTASGAAGFIKAVLALKNRVIPPSLCFEVPNRALNLIDSPFMVNTRLTRWERGDYPRRAAVNSLGMGGTNAHVVLEEAPQREKSPVNNQPQLLLLSAQTRDSLNMAKKNLADFLKKNQEINLADVAYTLQTRRKTYPYRAALVCSQVEEAIHALANPQSGKIIEYDPAAHDKQVEKELEKNTPVVSLSPDQIGRMWLYGKDIDWSSLYKKEKRHCIPLPTYAFDPQRYWIEAVDMTNLNLQSNAGQRESLADWFYTVSWKRVPHLKLNNNHNQQSRGKKTRDEVNWLIFLDEGLLGLKLQKKLKQIGHPVVTVKIGAAFKKTKESEYIINPAKPGNYRQLLAQLHASGTFPHKIIHLWNSGPGAENDLQMASYNDGQTRGFYSLLYLVQGISGQDTLQECEIIVITSDMQKVTGDETISPIKSTVLGPVYVIPQEHINIGCRSIDISLASPGKKKVELERLMDQLMNDLLHPNPGKITAYRKGHQWKQDFEPVKFADDSPKGVIKEKGVYLITGGLGRVGLILAKELAKSCQARLVLLGRSRLPERKQWRHWLSTHDEQNTTSHKIKKIRELEETGSQVLYFSADAAEIENMQQIKTRVEEKFGTINGIIHAAGGTRNESIGLIRDLDRDKCETQFKAKIIGLTVLDQLFKNEELDFFILTSSMTSFLGGWEYAAYTAANFFLDSFIQANDRWISLNLDPLNLESTNDDDGGITGKELVQTFKTILANVEAGQILISPTRIEERIQKATRALKDMEPEGETFHRGKNSTNLFPRPDLSTPYIPPTNEVESRLAEICRELFGYEKIGTRDNFFELGGNSLTIIKLISEIHKKFDAKIRIQDVFDKENLYELAGHIKNVEKETYFSIKAIEKKEYYVLSPAQKRLYILQQMNPVSIGYNLPRTIDLPAGINKEKMEIAFKKLIQRQESLRTSFEMCKEKPVQVIHDSDNINFSIEYFQLNDQNEPREKDPEILQITDNFIRPFDLGKAPLVRVGLVISRRRSVLIIDMHHIISDPVSEEVLAEEINAIMNGETVPGLFLQYKDYAEWQNSDMQQEQVKKEEKFWLKEFSGDLPVLNLPADYPRPTFRSFSGNIVYYTLSETETRGIRNFAKSNNATIYMTLISIYFILLYKISGDEDIIVGTPITSRRHADLERIVGMFVNTLAIRGYPGGNKLFSQFFYEIKNKILAVFENQQFQFEDLVEKAAVGRDVSRSPIFDVMFNLLIQEGFEGESASDPEEGVGIHLKGSSKFDISWYAFDSTGTIYFNIEYCNKIYKPETIDRFFKHFRTLLAGLSINTDQEISTMEILSPEEKKQVINDFNNTRTGYRAEKLPRHLFEEQVEKNPHRAAAVHSRQTLSYRELNASASQLAKLLRKKGTAPGTIVAIEIERSLEMLIGILAVLKAGSAFLPLDPLYPAEIKHYMKKDSSVPAALVRGRSPAKIFDIIISNNTLYPRKHANPGFTPGNRLDAPACVIYTPGTTGKPKGIIIEHRNLLTFLDAMYRMMEITSRHIIIGQASCSFSTFLEEVFAMLLKGGKIAVPGDEEIKDIHLLADFIIKHNVNIISCSPRRLKELKQITRETPLQIIISSGDVLTGEHTDRLLKSGKVFNRYGSIETTIGATCFPLDSPKNEPLPGIPIGKPLFNYQAYILDNYNQLLPVGIPGELCISGGGITRGYLNNPELTAQKFVHDERKNRSYQSYKSYIIYKTGDLARWLPDGNIEFLGRISDRVKIRGYRIKINEIENVLRKKEEIKETIVLPREDKNEEQYLCAYITVEEPLNKIILREFLLKSLPGYMFPSYFVELEEFPLTPGGKIDRKALPAPEITESDRYTPPNHYYEKKMVEIWSGILNINKEIISLNDNFFDLGGNSLQVINMITNIQEIFNVKVPVLKIFENATISNISKYIFMQDTIDVKLYTIFNKDKQKKVFCFPPGIGYGLIYSELSMHFKDYSFYAFNFIKDEDIIKRYVDVIIDSVNAHKKNIPIILMAYSQGGKTSFKVIEKLESLGYNVSDIILFDCVIPVDYRDSLIKKFEMNLEDGAKILESLLNEAGMGHMLDQVREHRKEYLNFHIGLGDFKPVNANIHLIASQERDKIREKFSGSRLIEFDRLTNGTYRVYKGFGTHELMLGGENLHQNINVLKGILLELQQ